MKQSMSPVKIDQRTNKNKDRMVWAGSLSNRDISPFNRKKNDIKH